MRKLTWLPLGMALAAMALPAAAQHRELNAHEHGRGTLNIAVEGNRLSMELEAPGADIVGFEHAARTRQQKQAVEKATAQLRAPQSLFQLPASAGCVAGDTKVAIEAEDREHDHAKEPAGKKAGSKKHTPAHDEHRHSQFHAEYALTCHAPANITSIEFGYFRIFTGARRLDVNLITTKGQTKFEVTRAKPRIDLAGQM